MTDQAEAARMDPFDSLRDLAGNPPSFVAATPNGAARLRAAGALHTLNDLILTADATVTEFEAVAGTLESTVTALADQPKRQPARWENSATMGMLNAQAPLLRADPDLADPLLFRCRSTFRSADEGFDGLVHGGLLSLILDQCCGAACAVAGKPAMTGTLNIRFERPAPLFTELTFFAKVESSEGRKVFVTAGVLNGDEVCARAEAVMIQPR